MRAIGIFSWLLSPLPCADGFGMDYMIFSYSLASGVAICAIRAGIIELAFSLD